MTTTARATEPAPAFVESPYQPNQIGNFIAAFQDRGYVTLPDVFERESVDAFRAQIEAMIFEDEGGALTIPGDALERYLPVKAPRIRQVLPEALSMDRMKPMPTLINAGWKIAEGGQAPGDPQSGGTRTASTSRACRRAIASRATSTWSATSRTWGPSRGRRR